MSQSVTEHRESAPKSVDCVVVTVSDTRTVETDKSGQIMRERLEAAGHRIVGYHIVRDEPAEIEQLLDRYAVASRDTTFDAISRRLEKTLPGFGELFRMLSFSEIGAAAMLSRATAGVLNGTLVISTPGSSNAVALAMDELIAPELAHIIFEINK